jgi:ketosteroid isomerase-like protein
MFTKTNLRFAFLALCLAVTTTSVHAQTSDARPAPQEVRPGVFFAGTMELSDSGRANLQALVLDLASAWARCDFALMEKVLSPDVDFSYPTNRINGIEAVKSDLKLFCEQAKDTSFYLPADAFYIDEKNSRVAVELQFRTVQRGMRQVVNDVWIANVVNGRISVLKEYLDGRVKNLQAQGVLSYEESSDFLTPWPSRTEAWKSCFPVLRVEPTNTCSSE